MISRFNKFCDIFSEWYFKNLLLGQSDIKTYIGIDIRIQIALMDIHEPADRSFLRFWYKIHGEFHFRTWNTTEEEIIAFHIAVRPHPELGTVEILGTGATIGIHADKSYIVVKSKGSGQVQGVCLAIGTPPPGSFQVGFGIRLRNGSAIASSIRITSASAAGIGRTGGDQSQHQNE